MVLGKNGNYAKVVQHSCDASNPDSEVVTFQLKYGLIIHAEMLRSRLLSRGVKSNRAIPMKKIREEVLNDPYVPVWFGAAQKGMVADVEVKYKWLCRQLWLKARYLSCGVHWIAEKLGAHKEWANRLLNPWQFVRETVTATEFDNLYNLRLHKDAQKDIQDIVKCMYIAHKESVPEPLSAGEWHVPYVTRKRDEDGVLRYYDNQLNTFYCNSDNVDGVELTAKKAIKASAARCARSSYDNHDSSVATYEKDIVLYNSLIDSEPVHASPVEHQASPMKSAEYTGEVYLWGALFEDGVTHIDKNGSFWSGNFKGWIQNRQLLDNHTCWSYKKEV